MAFGGVEAALEPTFEPARPGSGFPANATSTLGAVNAPGLLELLDVPSRFKASQPILCYYLASPNRQSAYLPARFDTPLEKR
jgi:hypothetical protein